MNATKIDLTENEVKGLSGIVNSDYAHGAYMDSKNGLVAHGVWTFSANTFENARSFSGVVSSLVKKGLVISTEDSGHGENDATLKLTEEGWNAVVAIGLIKDAPAAAPEAKVEEVKAVEKKTAPVSKGLKTVFVVTGYDGKGEAIFSHLFTSNKRLNALINAEDYFKKQGIDLDSAHRIDIVPV